MQARRKRSKACGGWQPGHHPCTCANSPPPSLCCGRSQSRGPALCPPSRSCHSRARCRPTLCALRRCPSTPRGASEVVQCTTSPAGLVRPGGAHGTAFLNHTYQCPRSLLGCFSLLAEGRRRIGAVQFAPGVSRRGAHGTAFLNHPFPCCFALLVFPAEGRRRPWRGRALRRREPPPAALARQWQGLRRQVRAYLNPNPMQHAPAPNRSSVFAAIFRGPAAAVAGAGARAGLC